MHVQVGGVPAGFAEVGDTLEGQIQLGGFARDDLDAAGFALVFRPAFDFVAVGAGLKVGGNTAGTDEVIVPER